MQDARPQTLAQLLRWRADRGPEAIVQTFTADDELRDQRSSGQLLVAAQRLAAGLREHARPGDRVVLALAPGLGFVDALFACFEAGLVAVPVPAPRRELDRERLRTIVAACRPALIIGEPELARAHVDEPGAVPCLDLAALDRDASPRELAGNVGTDELALLQYTSGSTGAPKGVCLSHANLLANLEQIRRAFELDASSVGVAWLPHFHDMGLIGTILAPVFVGFAMHRMSPARFLARPACWLEAISEVRASVSGGPNSAYGLCARAITDAEIARLELASWRVAFVGAEPVRAATMRAFGRRFAAAGFDSTALLPCYGLAESSLFVTGVAVSEPPSVRWFDAAALERGVAQVRDDDQGRALVGCGAPREEPRLQIVGPDGSAQADGRIGEVVVSGASVSRGYFGETPRPAAQTCTTGDLGFIHAGQLYLVGRSKDLIIVRGRNVYPEDLEAEAARLGPMLRAGRAAAFVVDGDDGELVVLVQEIREPAPAEGWDLVAEALRQRVGQAFELELHAVALVAAGEVRLTSSGKVRRFECRERWLRGALACVAVATASAPAPLDLDAVARLPPDARAARLLALLELWFADRCGRRLRADEPLGALGLDSLQLAELSAAFVRAGAPVSLARVLGSNLAELVAVGVEALAGSERGSPRAELPVDGRASSGERGFWHNARLAPDSSADVLVRAGWLAAEVDARALGLAFTQLVRDTPVLRARFRLVAGELVREIADPDALALELELERMDADPPRLLERARARLVAAISLERGPLVRALLLIGGGGRRLLAFAIHHAIVDEASLRRLAQGLADHYARALAGAGEDRTTTLEVARFAAWQAALLGERERELAARWRARLASLPTTPAGGSTPSLVGRPASVAERALTRGSAAALQTLARTFGCSPFCVLLALATWLLTRLDPGRDGPVCVALPVDLRTGGRFVDSVGYLANLLPLALATADDEPVAALVERCAVELRSALADQDLPFAEIVATHPGLVPELVLSHHPELADAGLGAWAANLADVDVELGPLRLRTAALAPRHAQFPLHLRTATIAGELTASVIADARRHDRATLEALLEALDAGLFALAERADARVGELPLTRRAWLVRAAPELAPVAVLPRIRANAASRPDAIALVCGDAQLSYAGLCRAVDGLAGRLRARELAQPEPRVGVSVARGPGLIVALLAVLAAGGVVVPLDPTLPDERLRELAGRADCALVVCDVGRGERFERGLELDAGALPRGSERARLEPRPPAALAYVLFTSGSTGEPKGVALTHAGLANFLAWAEQFEGRLLAGRVFAGTGIGFDLSIFELLGPLICGGTVVLGVDPLQLPAGYGVELLNTVPSVAAAMLAERTLPAELTAINLAGEALSWSLVEQLRARARAATIHNLYGPSETTTYSTFATVAGPELTSSERERPPSIGAPISATRCVLADERLRPTPTGLVAELYLGGDGLARGYLDRPRLTAERFVPDPSGPVGARLYRTGDRVRLDERGQLHYLGRVDRQLKLAGVRIEPGEIEAALLAHPGVSQAIVRVDPSARVLVAHVVARAPQPEPEALRRYLGERLPAAMIPAAVELLDQLPRTPRGKIDVDALAARRAPLRPEHEPPRDELERELAQIWAELLEVEPIGRHDDFFALGGHSLAATRLLARIERQYGVALAIRGLFERPSLAALGEALAAALRERGRSSQRPALAHDPARERWPLTPEQLRIWLADQRAPEHSHYNMPVVLRWRGGAGREQVAAALARTCERHRILRSRLVFGDGPPQQRVDRAPVLEVERGDGGELAERLAAAAARPFDLEREPPLRAVLIELPDDGRALLVTVHHVAADERSLQVLVGELADQLGLGEAPARARPAALAEFGDYASWLRRRFDEPGDNEALAAARAWATALAELDALPLTEASPRPGSALLADAVDVRLDAATLARLDALASQTRASRFAVLSAALGLTLARWTRQLDVPLATPLSARRGAELEHAVGPLLATMVLRVRIDHAATPRELVTQVRDRVLAALELGPVPLDAIARAGNRDDLGPLLRVLVVERARVPERRGALEVHELQRPTAKTELTVTALEQPGGVTLRLEYDRVRFETVDMAGFARTLARTLALFADAPDLPTRALGLLDDAGRQLAPAVGRGQDPRGSEPERFVGVVARILARAATHPDAIAVAGHGYELSYACVVDRALRLAARLSAAGLRGEQRVAVCLERGPELVPTLLGVLAAGLVHVPLDPRLPSARLHELLRCAEARVLITERSLAAAFTELPAATELLRIDELGERSARLARPIDVVAEQLAYLIFTSGSSGTPKGVAITQRSVAALLDWAFVQHGDALRAVLASSSVAFDLSVFELLAPLAAGGSVVLARDVLALPDHPQRWRVALLNSVPSAVATLAEQLPDTLAWINLAGEPLQRELVGRLLAARPGRRVFNLYGPAEDTTYSTVAEAHAGVGPAALGEPLPGTRMYLLDDAMQLAPEGALAELCLAGVGLARGYDGAARATAVAFVPDPFGPPGDRMYRTGDLARRRRDGALVFHGRRDRQIKLRGVRIEPGELEAKIGAIAGVAEVAVVALPSPAAPTSLLALCRLEPDVTLTHDALRRRCLELLPSSHQPRLRLVSELPRTASGKLDRAAIAKLAASLGPEFELVGPDAAPRTELEAELRELWATLLELDAGLVAVDADVFALGAHSLLVPQFLNRVQERYDIRLAVREVFERRTVRGLAAALERALAGRDAELLELLAQIESLSDDEVRALLERGEHPPPEVDAT